MYTRRIHCVYMATANWLQFVISENAPCEINENRSLIGWDSGGGGHRVLIDGKIFGRKSLRLSAFQTEDSHNDLLESEVDSRQNECPGERFQFDTIANGQIPSKKQQSEFAQLNECRVESTCET